MGIDIYLNNEGISKVFLGGTVYGEDPLYGWRGKLIPMLDIQYYNPVRSDWGPKALDEEYVQKYNVCNFSLFVITPDQKGYLTFAEIGDMVNKNPNGTIVCILNETFENDKKFTEGELSTLSTVCDLVKRNNGLVLDSLQAVAQFLNFNRHRKQPITQLTAF